MENKAGFGHISVRYLKQGKANLLVAANANANQARFESRRPDQGLAPKVGGGGGGRPDMAQAGGKKPAGIPAALAEAKNVIGQHA